MCFFAAAGAGAGAAAGSSTASTVAAYAAIAAAVVGAAASYQSSRTTAAIAKSNQKLAERQAEDAVAIGAVEEERYRAQVRRLAGAQRAAFAGNAVDFTTGTPLGILAETAKIGEIDALQVRGNAMRQAYGFGVQAANYGAEGLLARRAGRLQAGSTLLTGAAQAYGQYRG